MIKDNKKIRSKAVRLYEKVRQLNLKASEIDASSNLFDNEVGNLYFKLIKRLFEELGAINSYFEEDNIFADTSLPLIIEQEVLLPPEGEEFSVFYYRKLFNLLLREYHTFEATPLTNALENFFLDVLFEMDNSFNATFYKYDYDKLPDVVKTEYEYFLENLHEIIDFNFVLFFDAYGSLLKDLSLSISSIEAIFDNIPSLFFVEPAKEFSNIDIPYLEQRYSLKKKFLTSNSWISLASEIHSYINFCGYGDLSFNYYFEWDNVNRNVIGYKKKKQITLKDIASYKDQIDELVFNTKAFLNNYKANNVLIYGYRGCGKTSIINALLEEYKHNGLRLVKITREDIDDLPLLIEMLSNRKEKFIIAPDDLSYEENDPDYKRHKVIFDSVLDKCPDNVLIYATSNTQELVKFTKQFTTDDIKIDNRDKEEKKLEYLDKQFYDEKRALTDRFGLTLLFNKPDREMYSEMLFLHATKANVDISTDDKKQQLLKEYETWTLYHGTPCGRSSLNYISYIKAKQNL